LTDKNVGVAEVSTYKNQYAATLNLELAYSGARTDAKLSFDSVGTELLVVRSYDHSLLIGNNAWVYGLPSPRVMITAANDMAANGARQFAGQPLVVLPLRFPTDELRQDKDILMGKAHPRSLDQFGHSAKVLVIIFTSDA
jgi:hypothetical protein